MSDYFKNDELDKWLNFQLISKPEQSGKTFIMIEQIINSLTEINCNKETVNFILCDNNLLLTKQTSIRIDNDLKEYIHSGATYIEFSSHSRTKYNNTASIFQAIVARGARNIVCCTNSARMDDIYELINDINLTSYTSDKFEFRIWLDEADKFITFIDNTLRPIVDKYSNVYVHLITATSQPLFKKYEYINVFPIEVTTSNLYHGWKDNEIHIIEKEGNYLHFIEHILSVVAPNKIIPGTKWFIPGLNVKKSHHAVKHLCIEKGMAVICVNGDGIVITIPETLEIFKHNKDDNFNDKIIELYNTYRLDRFAVVITGYICIGRGITIISNDFMIDYAILSHYSDKNEASQLAGRIKGNIKGFINYKPCVVYTNEKFNNIVTELEEKSRTLATLAFEKYKRGEPTIIDKTEYKTCDKPYKYIIHETLFNSFEKAKEFLKSKEREMNAKVNTSKKSVIHILSDGYSVTSKLLKSGQTVDDLSRNDIITREKAQNIEASTCISSTNKGSRYLILPVYDNENSEPHSVKFQVRYIKFE